MILLILVLIILNVSMTAILILTTYQRKKKVVESEYYTDYSKGTLVMRVFKYEFEYQAIGDIDRGKLMDTGNLTINYRWALIDTSK